jgi:hypothetical protein
MTARNVALACAILTLSSLVAVLIIDPTLVNGDTMGTLNAVSGISNSMPPMYISGKFQRQQILALIESSFVAGSSSGGLVDAGYAGPDQLGNNGHTMMSGIVLAVVTGRSIMANFNNHSPQKGKRLSTKAGFERLLHLQLNESKPQATTHYCTRLSPKRYSLIFLPMFLLMPSSHVHHFRHPLHQGWSIHGRPPLDSAAG